MSGRLAVAVGHREAMLAEGIAAALARCPGIVPVGSAATPNEILALGAHADAAVIDAELAGARSVGERLRRTGVRVVYLGDGGSAMPGPRVSTHARIASLMSALDPTSQVIPRAPSSLTHREREVLSLVAEGLAAKQVAHLLGISHKTVERHKTRIFSKLGVPNAAAAVGFLASLEREGDAA